MKRLATAVLTVPLALAAVFLSPPWLFLLLVVLVLEATAWELVVLSEGRAPRRATGLVLVLVPVMAWLLSGPGTVLRNALPVAVIAVLTTVVAGLWVLAVRTPVAEVPAALGLIAFGTPYFAVPALALVSLQEHDPWWVFALFAIVWLGDTAAYYVGSRFGRHKLAPVLSPNKSWEGAAASLIVAVAAMAAFSAWRFDGVSPALLGAAAVTSIVAQAGDFVESCFKRAAGVKDSGTLLPGHGGFLDRLDATLFGAPVWWCALIWLGELAPPWVS